MRTAFIITAKDLRQRLRDRSAFLVAVVAPLALAFTLSVTISGFSVGSKIFKIGLVDLDHGPAASSLRDAMAKPGSSVALHDLATPAEGRGLVKDGKLDGAIVLPQGLSAASMGGPPVQIDVVGDPKNPIGALVGRSMAGSFASYMRTIQVASKALGAGPVETIKIAGRVSSSSPPVSISDTSTTKRNLDPKTYYSAAMAVFFLFFAVQFGISSLLNERSDGTLARMLAAPIHRGSILVGKAMTSLALGLTSMTVLALTTRFAIGAYWGNPLGVAVLIVCAVLAATAVTALVTTLAKTADQANAWLTIVSIVLGMLGGSFFPVAQAGGLLAALSKATPHAWFLSGLQDLSSGGSLSVIVEPVLVLLGIALVCGSVALVRIRRLIEP
ncbi:MAG: ABC transporter permease [Gaiellaceae bacterium]